MGLLFKYFVSLIFIPLRRGVSIWWSLFAGCSDAADNLLEDAKIIRREAFAKTVSKTNLSIRGDSVGIIRFLGENDYNFRNRIDNAFLFYNQANKKSFYIDLADLYGLDVEVWEFGELDKPTFMAEWMWAELAVVYDVNSDLTNKELLYFILDIYRRASMFLRFVALGIYADDRLENDGVGIAKIVTPFYIYKDSFILVSDIGLFSNSGLVSDSDEHRFKNAEIVTD